MICNMIFIFSYTIIYQIAMRITRLIKTVITLRVFNATWKNFCIVDIVLSLSTRVFLSIFVPLKVFIVFQNALLFFTLFSINLFWYFFLSNTTYTKIILFSSSFFLSFLYYLYKFFFASCIITTFSMLVVKYLVFN